MKFAATLAAVVGVAAAASSATSSATALPTGIPDAATCNCYLKYSDCQTAPDANQAYCASQFAGCVGYSPFTGDSRVTAYFNNLKKYCTAAGSYTSAPGYSSASSAVKPTGYASMPPQVTGYASMPPQVTGYASMPPQVTVSGSLPPVATPYAPSTASMSSSVIAPQPSSSSIVPYTGGAEKIVVGAGAMAVGLLAALAL